MVEPKGITTMLAMENALVRRCEYMLRTFGIRVSISQPFLVLFLPAERPCGPTKSCLCSYINIGSAG